MEIPFTSVFEYMILFQRIALACKPLESQLMVYSAAAVSDFYIPMDIMNEHKIQSSEGSPNLPLTNTPKMLLLVTKEWVPNAYNISFKLETDTSILLNKATSAILK